MIAKVSGRKLRVIIGDDLENWSHAYSSFEANYESLGDSSDLGLIKVLGTLVLEGTYILPSDLNPRTNPTRWRPGTPVYVQARNDADTAWIDTWFSRLRILEEPAAPRFGASAVPLSLQLGCLLTWSDTFQLDDDQSGVSFGTSETTDQIASRLLQASDIPAANISLNTWPYSLAYPFGKDTDSFTGKAGELAYSNDWRYLYQSTAGTITDAQLNLTPSTPVATVTIGENDIVWEPLPDPQQPPETTKAAGIGYDLTTVDNPDINTVEIEDNLANYDPNAAGIGIVQRTTTTESFNLGNPSANPVIAPSKFSRVHIFSIEAIIFQKPSIPTQLVEYTDQTIAYTYESGLIDPTQAKLAKVEETFRQREKSIVPDGEFLNMRIVKTRTTDYTYSANESISRSLTVEQQAEVILDELSANPWNLRTTLVEDFNWTEYAPGQYDREDIKGEALTTQQSGVDKTVQNIWALRRTTTPYSRRDPNTPPATEYFDAGISQAEVHYEGTASFIHPGGATGRNRERLYTVPFGFSTAQMQGLASKHRDILHGRHRGDEIELAVNDALLQAPPLPEIHVTQQGDIFIYLADALAVSFEPTRTTAHCLGLWIDGGYQETLVGGFTINQQHSGGLETPVNFTGGFTMPAQVILGSINTVPSLSGGFTMPNQELTGQLIQPESLTGGFTSPNQQFTGQLTQPESLIGGFTMPDQQHSGQISEIGSLTGGFNMPDQQHNGELSFPGAVDFSNVQLLLEGEGTNGSTTFTDSSSAARIPSAVGIGTTITTAQFQVGSSSIDFDGVNSVLEYADSGDFTAAGDLSWEFWARITDFASTDGGANRAPLATGNSFTVSSPGLLLSPIDATTGNLLFFNGSTRITAGPIAINVWTHIAVCRVGGVWTIYLDGAASGGTYSDSSSFDPSLIRIGASVSNTVGNYAGQMDSIRFVVGESAYDGNFTPPTSPHPTS